MKRFMRCGTPVITAILLCVVAYAQQQPPAQVSLGDLVKQQKAAKKATKIVTDDDMPARPPEATLAVGAAVSSDSRTAADAAKPVAAAPVTPKPTGEQARQDKIKNLRESEEAAKKVISQIEEELTDPNLSENRRRMYSDTLDLSREQLDKYTKEREALEQQAPTPKPPQGPETEKQ